MSDNTNFGFGKFVPGFDFLQNLAKGASQTLPQMPNLSNWVAPTLNVEELDKRIGELKAVHFWLDQNSNALAATIQALEVQKMTLATLKGMNFNMGELAKAMTLKPAEPAADKPAEAAKEPVDSAHGAATRRKPAAGAKASNGVVDPLQWWGALTQQFQQIAADAMQEAARSTAVDGVRTMATGMATDAMTAATRTMESVAPGSGAKPARKAPARSTRARKTAAGKSAGRKTASR